MGTPPDNRVAIRFFLKAVPKEVVELEEGLSNRVVPENAGDDETEPDDEKEVDDEDDDENPGDEREPEEKELDDDDEEDEREGARPR